MSGICYDDITAALDYYFENYNEGRPFVIAGHSQGAAILRLVLKDYFKDHPEYYERMVAAYPIGYSVTKDFLEENPHLKFATGETDTGVIISWNTEGPKNVEENATNVLVLPNAISINPLNWKLDETYAPASENLGSVVIDEKTGTTEILDIGGDAQVNIARGTVITNADAVPNDMTEYTGPQSYHQDDYSIFYNNIKDNVAKRIAAYQENSSDTTEDEKEETSKSAHLLADGYELAEYLTLPVGLSNKDLDVENSEPEKAEKLSIDGTRGKEKLNLYVFRPEKAEDDEVTPVIYYMHGGGYQFGNTALFEEGIQDLADANNATVVSVDYPLTLDPDYKYPMELEDAYAGLLYVYEHADELNVDKDNIIIEGESAGGGLTARLALYNRDKGEVPLKGQVLVYPMLDYRTGGEEDIYNNEYAGEFVWTKENNISGWADLKAGQEKELTDEEMVYFSPATATADQLKGLPEAIVIVGSLDLFCDEDMDYAKKLMEAGVFTELYVEPGVPHAYDAFAGTPQEKRFNELRDNAIARMFGTENDSNVSEKEEGYECFINYLIDMYNAEEGK
jgi:acetyl esterase/lipase